MRNFFMASCFIGIWCITVIELLMVCLSARMLKQKENKALIGCVLLISIGLFIDALFISLGTVLNPQTLGVISPLRFISHGVLIPLIFPICVYALDGNKTWVKVIWALTVLLMIAGFAEAIATKLELKEIAGVIRYVAGANTPVWAEKISTLLSFGTVIPLMIVGIVVWIKQKTPALFLSGFFMFAFSALGPATGNADLIFYISMYGEVLMVLFFIIYTKNK